MGIHVCILFDGNGIQSKLCIKNKLYLWYKFILCQLFNHPLCALKFIIVIFMLLQIIDFDFTVFLPARWRLYNIPFSKQVVYRALL